MTNRIPFIDRKKKKTPPRNVPLIRCPSCGQERPSEQFIVFDNIPVLTSAIMQVEKAKREKKSKIIKPSSIILPS